MPRCTGGVHAATQVHSICVHAVGVPVLTHDASPTPPRTVQCAFAATGGLSNAVDGIRAANASLATTVEGLLQPAVAPETEPRAKIVSARAFNESRVREQARVAKQREAGTKDSQEQVIVALDGSPNQPCDAVCAAQDLAVRQRSARVRAMCGVGRGRSPALTYVRVRVLAVLAVVIHGTQLVRSAAGCLWV